RDLPRRWHRDGRNAVPRGRGTDLRRVQRNTLQTAGARGPLSWEEHSRGAEPHSQRGAEVFRRGPQDHREVAFTGRSRPRLSAFGAVGDDTLWRRGATHEAGGAFAAREP